MVSDTFLARVESGVGRLELAQARAKWRDALTAAIATAEAAMTFPDFEGLLDVDAMLKEIARLRDELQTGDVTPDVVAQSPIRQVPLDMVAAAVALKAFGLPPTAMVLHFKAEALAAITDEAIDTLLEGIAQRWAGTPVREKRDHAFDESLVVGP